MNISFFGFLLEVDVSNAVDDEDLAVFGNGSLLGTNRAAGQLCFDRRADPRSLCFVGEFGSLDWILGGATSLLFACALLASVPVHGHWLFFLSSCWRRRRWCCCGAIDA